MSTTTPYLDLFKIIPVEDAKKTFNFYEILNNNWDKLDNSYSEQVNQIQRVLDLMYNTVYRIGQPIIRLDDYLAENEVRLEGEEKLISEFPLLYQVYGNTYGEARIGYFKLPDCRNRVFWGAENFGYIEAGLPNITAEGFMGENYNTDSANIYTKFRNQAKGALYYTSKGGYYGNNGGIDQDDYLGIFDASRSNSIYGKSETVQPPAIKVRVVTRFK
jgi:hypothetical protein